MANPHHRHHTHRNLHPPSRTFPSSIHLWQLQLRRPDSIKHYTNTHIKLRNTANNRRDSTCPKRMAAANTISACWRVKQPGKYVCKALETWYRPSTPATTRQAPLQTETAHSRYTQMAKWCAENDKDSWGECGTHGHSDSNAMPAHTRVQNVIVVLACPCGVKHVSEVILQI